jgi:hypothetical protein
MATRQGAPSGIRINRAPVLTLWAAVVAERLGHDWPGALTLGKAVAGLNAQSKGRALGIYDAPARKGGERAARAEAGAGEDTVMLLHRRVPVVRSRGGVRAVVRGVPVAPESVERYLRAKFQEGYEAARDAMRLLARSRPPRRLAEEGYALYEEFRPEIPAGRRGWGVAGVLDLARLRSLARDA